MLKFHCSADQIKKIHDLLLTQKKIDAIKEVKDTNHCGLKEAKDAIELYAWRMEGAKRDTLIDFNFGNAIYGTSSAELVTDDHIGLSSLSLRLTGNRYVEMDETDKIDIITSDGNLRFSIDELRMIVKFYDGTRVTD